MAGLSRIAAIGVALYLAFVALVGWSFWDRDLWSDEAVSLILIGGHDPAELIPGTYRSADLAVFYDPAPQGSITQIWSWAAERDNHPPGYSALVAALVSPGQFTADGVRLLNIALSGLFIFPMLLLMREFGWRPAWTTAALATMSPFAFYAAREIRAYGIVMVLATAAAWISVRLLRPGGNRWVLVLALIAINAAGCALHKLFLLVVAAQCLMFVVAAISGRDLRLGLLALVVGAPTAALAVLIPNLLSVAPTLGAFETAWLHKPLTAYNLLNAAVTYLAYFGAWWIGPPDRLAEATLGYAFVAVFLPLFIWLLYLAGRALLSRTNRAVAALVIVPPILMLVAFAATGNDFSQAARYSIIWTPVAAALLITSLKPGAETRLFSLYAGASLAVGGAFVLFGISHSNPDETRAFVEASAPATERRIVWLLDDTLNNRGLLLAYHSEMARAGETSVEYVLVAPDDISAVATGGDLIAGPTRYAELLQPLCMQGGAILKFTTYFSCEAR